MARQQTANELQMDNEDRLTLLDLVAAVQDSADDNAEVMATLRHMAETGHVTLEIRSFDVLPWAA